MAYPDTSNWKLLLQEDDCAPDAHESFCEKFRWVAGITYDGFQKRAICTDYDDGFYVHCQLGDLVTTISADDPHLSLYRIPQ